MFKSASSKRSRSRDQASKTSKPARSETTTPHRSFSPQRDYPRGTVTKPTQASPKHAQDLANFKSDMTSLIKDMIQSSLSTFASQFKSDSGGKGESSQDQAQEVSQEGDPSPDHGDPSEGEEGELASDKEDPDFD